MNSVMEKALEMMVGQRVPPQIVLRDFLSTYSVNLKGLDDDSKSNDIVEEITKLSKVSEAYKTTAKNCSLSHLATEDDPIVTEYLPGCADIQRQSIKYIPKNAIKLKSYEMLNEHKVKENSQINPFRRTRDIYKSPRPPLVNSDNERALYYKELIVTVRIYRPPRATHVGKTLEKPVFSEEFDCLGSNKLTDLRDKISCVCNSNRFFDVSEDPNTDLPIKDTDPGYFFINDTFYNDMRNPSNADYSQTVREWAKSADGLKNVQFKVAKMEETRFIDLAISLGFPQVYQHHGNCEHLFTFSQVEILSPSTLIVPRTEYPFCRSYGLFNTRQCNMCGSNHYVFIVEQSNRQLHDPAYLCSNCFHSYHYINGKKIGTFKAYRINTNNYEPIANTQSHHGTGTSLTLDTSDVEL